MIWRRMSLRSCLMTWGKRGEWFGVVFWREENLHSKKIWECGLAFQRENLGQRKKDFFHKKILIVFFTVVGCHAPFSALRPRLASVSVAFHATLFTLSTVVSTAASTKELVRKTANNEKVQNIYTIFRVTVGYIRWRRRTKWSLEPDPKKSDNSQLWRRRVQHKHRHNTGVTQHNTQHTTHKTSQ